MRDWITTAGHTSDLYDLPTDLPDFLWKYSTYDLVIPMFHGIYGEDGQVTAFLATLGCRYASSDATVHALCIDKHLTNQVVANLGVKVPRSLYLKMGQHIDILEPPLVCYPVIMKPNKWGSSIWASKVHDRSDLIPAQSSIIWDDILIQECIEGREFTVAVYKNETGYHALPIMEIVSLKNEFFDYEEKYETDGSNEIWMEWEDELQRRLSSESQRICGYIGTRGIVRIDWRYDGRDIYFLEVNTIPGFTSGSFVPKMWKKAGKSEAEMVGMLGC
jgi:D-alanine-D-alanine ligase